MVAALEYVHGKGFVHGRICPANIMAAGDQVKLSSDSVREAGEMPRSASAYDAPEVAAHGFSAASDVWSLGITLVEALTQHAPAWDATRMSVPAVGEEIAEPFRGIAQRCLEIDPRKRCGLLEIGERLAANAALGEAGVIREAEIDSAIAPARKFTTWRRWIVPAVVVAVTIFVILRPRSPKGPTDGETAAVQSAATDSTEPGRDRSGCSGSGSTVFPLRSPSRTRSGLPGALPLRRARKGPRFRRMTLWIGSCRRLQRAHGGRSRAGSKFG